MASSKKRCSNGFRRNRSTGRCQKNTGKKRSTGQKRCSNGFRRNRSTGRCQKSTGKKRSTGQKRSTYNRRYSSRPLQDMARPQGYRMWIHHGLTKRGNLSQKFWGVRVRGNEVCTTWGAVGASPRFQCHRFADPHREVERLERQKVGHGYRRAGR